MAKPILPLTEKNEDGSRELVYGRTGAGNSIFRGFIFYMFFFFYRYQCLVLPDAAHRASFVLWGSTIGRQFFPVPRLARNKFIEYRR